MDDLELPIHLRSSKSAHPFHTVVDEDNGEGPEFDGKNPISRDLSEDQHLQHDVLSNIRQIGNREPEVDILVPRTTGTEDSAIGSHLALKPRISAQEESLGAIMPATSNAAKKLIKAHALFSAKYKPLDTSDPIPGSLDPEQPRKRDTDEEDDQAQYHAEALENVSAKVKSILDPKLYESGPHPQLFQYLLNTIAKLETEKLTLERRLYGEADNEETTGASKTSDTSLEGPKTAERPLIYETFHLVYSTVGKRYFRDVPRKFEGDLLNDVLRGRDEVENISTYMENHSRTAFAIIYTYSSEDYLSQSHHTAVGYKGGRLMRDTPPPEPVGQHVNFSERLCQALETRIRSNPDRFEGYTGRCFLRYMMAPYFLFYMHNETFLELLDSDDLDEEDRAQLELLCRWFDENWSADWKEGNELLSRGKINAKHYPKLFRPGELMFSPDQDGLIHASKIKVWPWEDDEEKYVDAFGWSFNGSFRKDHFQYQVHGIAPLNKKDEEIEITSLSSYPLRFAKEEVYGQLLSRGEKFWMCRKMKPICSKETDPSGSTQVSLALYAKSWLKTRSSGMLLGPDMSQVERRFIVDYQIFRRMHKTNNMFVVVRDDLGEEAMNKHEPPEGDFLALLPPYIHGFSLQTKSWHKLRVDLITDITWNKDAFKRLVIPDETKELIQALVTAQSNQMRIAPDIIAGKGSGLIILLHGGPGTGKTLTAESIAEYEERPLYRITCGDVGMEPEDVEKYLEATLYVGKAWGCVVLLDEADVFIEERSLTDMKRNALVSVFLRVLEYYDGILVLTSNRVGTFDEAFKSRIQLALRYPNLDQEQRQEIWRNFFQMLRRTKERVDMDDLEMNIDALAAVDINGRQIRNIVTMARHLAKFRKERLVYRHVQLAIQTVTKFEEYLTEVKGVSDDNWAREDKLR